MSKSLKESLGYILGATLALAWPLGVIHAGLHHGGGRTALSFLIPPYGVYMAAESLVHNDALAAEKNQLLTAQQELDASMETLQEVINLSQVRHPTVGDKKRLRDSAVEALQHGENFLAKAKMKSQVSGFDDAFRGQYLAGLRKIKDGLDSNDLEEMSAGARMLNQFIDWMQTLPRGSH